MVRYSILIVEDSPTQRGWLVAYFKNYGFTKIVEAENGAIAKRLTEDLTFDLIVCDLEMPVMDGIELIQNLAEKKVPTPMIIASQRERNLISSVELMATMSGVNVMGSLQKPFTIDELDGLMDSYLHQKAVLEKAEETSEPDYINFDYIRSAIIAGQITLQYQPKIRINDNSISGIEALVRLIGPSGELIYPDSFIGLCERTGLIDDLTFEVVKHCFQQLEEWNAQGIDVPMSINLSARSFNNKLFCEQLVSTVKGSGYLATQLIFEVTETAVTSDFSNALSVLSQLRLLGCGLSIDDYGTGYSSVKLLTQIPFTELKLDRSLVDGITSNKHLQAIFTSTRDMCYKLKLNLVCEGIESETDRQFLVDNHCEYGQGYLFSKPLDASDIYYNFLASHALKKEGDGSQ